MSDLRDVGGEGFLGEAAVGNATPQPASEALTASASFKIEGKSAPALRRRASMKPNLEVDEFIYLLHGSDPVKVELNRLENEVRGGIAEENKILDKMHRQKVAEVEKLSQTVRELEEAVLAGGAAANAVRDYQRKEEMKTLDRELARAKVTANRVAVVVANEWKDANDKVMPVKQWLEERRFMQVSIDEKFQIRLKVLEEGLRMSAGGSNRTIVEGKSVSNSPSRRQSFGGAENVPKSVNGFLSKRPSFQMRSSLSSSTVLKHAKGASKSFDGGTRSLDRSKALLNGVSLSLNRSSDATAENISHNRWKEIPEEKANELPNVDSDDCVSGLLYDMLQKEVITLRKACHEKDQSLKDKDDAIEMLAKKVDTLTKAMEVEAKKMRREVAAMEKEVAAMRVEKEQDNKSKRLGGSKAPSSSSQLLPGRYDKTVPRGGLMRNL
ncbi:hypothetical protein B296_00037767 [Ensete ventricosum]|uniref:Microtubule-associated protein 70-2 n=1 Tax=Ensete ventricosum TaxID=4639 RepID=A0A426ZYB8_ENSVE|nr:hypothetical protein B296_00037767 [Ensete ventricosum]